MPFQSDKQRRYLWANEPEIAREWTDRYGAKQGGIAALDRRHYFSGEYGGGAGDRGGSPTASRSENIGAGRAPEQGGASHSPHRDTGAQQRAQAEADRLNRQSAIRDDIARREAEKDYVDKQRIMHDFGQRQLIGQQKRQEHKPSFWNRLRGGIGNLLRGAGNVFKYVNPMTLASGGANLMGEQGIARLLAALNIGKGATAFSNQNEIPDYNNLGLYTDRIGEPIGPGERVGQDIRWDMPDNLSADTGAQGIGTLEDQMREIFTTS